MFRRPTIFWGIVLSALTIRIGFVILMSPRLDSLHTLSVDASSYHQIAQNLIERHIFTSSIDPPYNPQLPGTFRPPLTPLYLAAIYAIFGVNLVWGRFGLAIISALSCGLTYVLGKKIFGQTVGLLAGIISCGYPFFLLLVHLPLTEGFSIFLSLVLMILLYSYLSQTKDHVIENSSGSGFCCSMLRLRWEIGAGFVFGLALLNKAANITLFPCILLAFLRSGTLKKRLLRLIVILIVLILTLLPWTIRNYLVVETLIPVNSNGGWTFYLGNNPHTEKNLSALEQGNTNGWIPPKEVFQPFSDLSFTDIVAWEKRSLKLGYLFIRENPGKFFHLAYRKLKIFWSPYHHVFDKITWYPLALLGLVGLWYSFASRRQNLILYIFVLSTMSIPVVFTAMPRFRAPLIPVVMVYAAAGTVNIYRFMKEKMRK